MAPYSFKNSALKYMLAHVPGKDGEELLSYFGEHQRKEIREALDLPENPFTTTIPPKEWLTLIHPLWVKEGINSCLPPAELYLNIIPKESQEQFAAIDEKILTDIPEETKFTDQSPIDRRMKRQKSFDDGFELLKDDILYLEDRSIHGWIEKRCKT
jgi:hypothetical protein